MRLKALSVFLGGALLAGCAGAPAPGGAPAPTLATATSEAATVPPATEAATVPPATEAATVPPTTEAGDGAAVSELGVSLSYPAGLGITGVRIETVPAAGVGDPQLPVWAVVPEHRRVSLEGYAQQGNLQPPVIAVFPIEGYGAAAPRPRS